jgi:hypothetical protein
MSKLFNALLAFVVPNWLRGWPSETADFLPLKRKR